MLLGWLIVFSTAFAQTEVEGEVSGEWNAEGSPYIVVDSTWVPQGERLTLLEGVEVRFNEDQGLHVFGDINATGTEDDSVLIRVSEGVEHWKSIHIFGRALSEWEFTSIICPENVFTLEQNTRMTLDHCLINAREYSFYGTGRYGITNCILTFRHSTIISGESIITAGGRLTASNSFFDFSDTEREWPGIDGEGTGFRITSCEFIGSVVLNNGGYSIIDSSRFLMTPDGRLAGAVAIGSSGRMTESYVEGDVAAYNSNGRIMPLHNNVILGALNVGDCSVDISGCRIDTKLRVTVNDGESITIRNSIVRGVTILRDMTSVLIDSSYFIVNPDYNRIESYFSARNIDQLNVTRSLFDLRLNISEVEEAVFDHNTIIPNMYADRIIEGINVSGIDWTNNIFITLAPGGRLFGANLPQIFEYNCVWGFDYAGGRRNDLIPLDSLSETNVIANPLIDWQGMVPSLAADSPCIDSGDPEAPQDPDQTRSDIGARSFNHDMHAQRIEVDYPASTLISDIYPNPFNGMVTIFFELNQPELVNIDIFNSLGRWQTRLVSGYYGAGKHSVLWAGLELPSGNYLIRMIAGGEVNHKKITMIK